LHGIDTFQLYLAGHTVEGALVETAISACGYIEEQELWMDNYKQLKASGSLDLTQLDEDFIVHIDAAVADLAVQSKGSAVLLIPFPASEAGPPVLMQHLQLSC